MGDLTDYSAEQLLRYAYPEMRRSNSGDLPVYRYLSQLQTQEDFPQIRSETKSSSMTLPQIPTKNIAPPLIAIPLCRIFGKH